MPKSLVSILIPVYNGSQTIEAAIRSCLNQTYEHFELLIYNDGSTDNTHQVIQQLSDTRIIYLNSNINQGIAYSRNLLLKQSKGDFIAWLDADDEMLKDRLEKQLAFFEKNPSVDICGSWMYLKNKQDNSIILAKTICNSNLLKTALWFKNYMFQPTVMSRNFYVRENIFYNEAYNFVAEDYDLWVKIMNVKTFANIAEPLIFYNQLNQSDVKIKQAKLKLKEKLELIWKEKWKQYSFTKHQNELTLFEMFIYENRKLKPNEISSFLNILNKFEENLTDKNTAKLMVAYHQCRIFRNANFIGKILNLNLLKSYRFFFKFKRFYLIS